MSYGGNQVPALKSDFCHSDWKKPGPKSSFERAVGGKKKPFFKTKSAFSLRSKAETEGKDISTGPSVRFPRYHIPSQNVFPLKSCRVEYKKARD